MATTGYGTLELSVAGLFEVPEDGPALSSIICLSSGIVLSAPIFLRTVSVVHFSNTSVSVSTITPIAGLQYLRGNACDE